MAFPTTSAPLALALEDRGYTEPTPVQSAVLGDEVRGRDLIVSAQTGSGKTIAYGLAIGETLLGDAEIFERAGDPLALIVAPTRELALQVHNELNLLYRHTRARILSCVGGMDPRRENRQLADGAHIVVGTPGRLRDHLERGALRVSALKALVLDEADEMLDLGFRDDLEFILKTTPADRRTLLFSATLPKQVIALARNYQQDALRLQVSAANAGHADIEYRAIRVAQSDIEHAVVNLLRFIDPKGALVFCNTREAVRHLQAILQERGFSAVALSGELSQSERNHALQALRDGRVRICVATDVAARGIDLPHLDLVIHADLPHDAEVLQHRSGRTGRAGRKGVSILLVAPARRRKAEQIFGNARLQPEWGTVPSVDDIHRRDHERLITNPLFAEAPSEQDAAMARLLLESRSPEEIATAFARLYRAQLPEPELLADPGDPPRRDRAERYERKEKNREHDRERNTRFDAPPPRRRESGHEPLPEKSVWFRLDLGRSKNADPKWLLPMLCRRGKITKADIGAIRIADDETLFEIRGDIAADFAHQVRHSKSNEGSISPADGAPSPAPRDYTPRMQHEGASGKEPRPHGKPRHEAKAPFAHAKGGDAPLRKPWKKKGSDWYPAIAAPEGVEAPHAAKAHAPKPFEKQPFEKKPFEKKGLGGKAGGKFQHGADERKGGKPFGQEGFKKDGFKKKGFKGKPGKGFKPGGPRP